MYFEDLTEGMKFVTRRRFLTSTDVELFTSMTWAVNPLFLSDEVAKSVGMRGRLAPGALLVSVAIGLLYQVGLFDNIRAMTELKANFLSAVSPGDTVVVEAIISSKKVLSERNGEITIDAVLKNLTTGKDAVSLFLKLIYLRKSQASP